MQSKAATVKEYLASLPEDRRKSVERVRGVILENIDPVFEERMQYGMIGYCVPHRVFPAGYHCDPSQPVPFAGLASQKGHMSLYTMCLYMQSPLLEWFRAAWAKTGKKLDMGKACIRFKDAEQLALDVIGELFRRATAEKYLEVYTSLLAGGAKQKAGAGKTKKAGTGKPARATAKAPKGRAGKKKTRRV